MKVSVEVRVMVGDLRGDWRVRFRLMLVFVSCRTKYLNSEFMVVTARPCGVFSMDMLTSDSVFLRKRLGVHARFGIRWVERQSAMGPMSSTSDLDRTRYFEEILSVHFQP